jgi:hypothetical protein
MDLATGAGVEDQNLQPHRASPRFYESHRDLRSCGIGRINQHTYTGRSGYEFTQNFQPLGYQLGREKIDARQVAVRPREARDKTKLDRVLAGDENNGDCRSLGWRVARAAARRPTSRKLQR